MPPLCCHSPSPDCECERCRCTDTVMPSPHVFPACNVNDPPQIKARYRDSNLPCEACFPIRCTLSARHVTLGCFYCRCCCCCLFWCVSSVKCTEGRPCLSSLNPNHDKSSSASWCRHQVKQKIRKLNTIRDEIKVFLDTF